MDFKTVKEKYFKNYIRDDQLVRFRDLGVITEEQYEKLYALKHPAEWVTGESAE